MPEVSNDICKLFSADRLTWITVNDHPTSIVSKVKSGLNSAQNLKLPIRTHSIADYVAMAKQMVNIGDTYDFNTPKNIHLSLSFLQAVDKRLSFYIKQMLVASVMSEYAPYGLSQVIDNRSNQSLSTLKEDDAQRLCETLVVAIRRRIQNQDDNHRKRTIKYGHSAAEALLSQHDFTNCIKKAREQA